MSFTSSCINCKEREEWKEKDKEKDEICSVIDNEGFDYTFTSKTSFKDIKDEEFHKLRNEYIQAQKKLSKYVGWDNWEG